MTGRHRATLTITEVAVMETSSVSCTRELAAAALVLHGVKTVNHVPGRVQMNSSNCVLGRLALGPTAQMSMSAMCSRQSVQMVVVVTQSAVSSARATLDTTWMRMAPTAQMLMNVSSPPGPVEMELVRMFPADTSVFVTRDLKTR